MRRLYEVNRDNIHFDYMSAALDQGDTHDVDIFSQRHCYYVVVVAKSRHDNPFVGTIFAFLNKDEYEIDSFPSVKNYSIEDFRRTRSINRFYILEYSR